MTTAPSGAAGETHPEAPRRAHLTALLSLCLAVGVTAVAFVSAWTSLGPDSLLLRPFNSDGAVPVLMANQTHWDFLSAFYWGEDRYGAWPFFVAHGLSLLFRVPVTPEFLHGFSTLFLFSGALAAALLFRPYAGLGLLAFTVSVLLPESRGSLFDANPYAWQLPLLLWAWWCVRESLTGAPGPPPRVVARPCGPGLVFCHLDVGLEWAPPPGSQPPRGVARTAHPPPAPSRPPCGVPRAVSFGHGR